MIEYHKIHTIWKRDTRGFIQQMQPSKPVFEYLASAIWRFTEKVDGTNIRVHWDGSKIFFGGRTDAASIPAMLVDHLRSTFTEEKMRAKFGASEVCLYGEGFGAKIQAGGGNYKSDGQSFVLFDVLCGRFWLERSNVEEIAISLGIPIVPIVMQNTLFHAEQAVIDGITSSWGNFQAEGLVGVPLVDLFDRHGERIIVKMKTKDYARLAVVK